MEPLKPLTTAELQIVGDSRWHHRRVKELGLAMCHTHKDISELNNSGGLIIDVGFDNVQIGYSVGIDTEPIASKQNPSEPQSGISTFAEKLGIANKNLLTILPAAHSNDVFVASSLDATDYRAREGRRVPYDGETSLFDGLIVPRNDETEGLVLALTGADCTPIVGHCYDYKGQEYLFGIHAGNRGGLSGVVKCTADKMLELGINFSSIELLIGAGAQSIELPDSKIREMAANNPDRVSSNSLGYSAIELFDKGIVSTVYSDIETREVSAIYDSQLFAASAVLESFGQECNVKILDANTMTSDLFPSHRARMLAEKAGDMSLAHQNSGRYMVYAKFKQGVN